MVLKGWKDIAKYLGCGVRTVQRWEKLGMPVRRPSGGASRSAVVAISGELEVWLTHDSQASDSSGSPESTASDAQRFWYRILVADNDEARLVKLAAQLADDDYGVRTARDGFEALAAMREAPPDLLVTDLRMPNMSGFELLSIVRKRFPAMAVIVCSGEFAALGTPDLLCDRYIERNCDSSSKLLTAIRELLTQSPLRSQLAKATMAPAWLPRATNGYFVLTCTDCLRSFSVMTRSAPIGKDAAARCSHCGVNVNYHIDDSLLPIQADLKELIQYRDERRRSGHFTVRSAKRHRSIGKSLPRKQS